MLGCLRGHRTKRNPIIPHEVLLFDSVCVTCMADFVFGIARQQKRASYHTQRNAPRDRLLQAHRGEVKATKAAWKASEGGCKAAQNPERYQRWRQSIIPSSLTGLGISFFVTGMFCDPSATNKLASALFAGEVVPRPHHEVDAVSAAAIAWGHVVFDGSPSARDACELLVAELDSIRLRKTDLRAF